MSLGTLEQQSDDTATIRFVRRLAHPIDKVWQAITQPEEMLRWWGDGEVDLREGGSFVVRWLNTLEDGTRAEMHATITRLEPPRLLETDGDVHGVLRWELEPDGDATVLTFSSTLALPDEFRTKVLAGWHWHLDALADALDGGRADLVELPGWEDVHRGYAPEVA
jgi:uncharacterized protein YndB with AHSA1/START domain